MRHHVGQAGSASPIQFHYDANDKDIRVTVSAEAKWQKTMPQIRRAGEQALFLDIAEVPSPEALSALLQLEQQIRLQFSSVLLDVVPAYVSIMLVYDVLQLTEAELIADLLPLCQHWLAQPLNLQNGRKLQLPCYYHTDIGPDLARVAALHQLSCDEVIRLHQQQRYLVYCIGFAPGFAYLGFVDPRLATPRLSQPRALVPAGAVGIADQQTAVYPAASPGGWNLIGNCPIPLFDPAKRPMMPFAVGDSIEFVAISKAEFISLGGDISAKVQAAR